MLFLIGEQYVSECIDPRRKNIGCDKLTKQELQTIQDSIKATTRPSWHCGPPSNLGDPSHGKLKADQWRSCIEFDLPVSLAKLFATNCSDSDLQQRDRQKRMLESTMFLAMAIRWGTSHRTSREHAEKYMEYMHAYLESLLHLYPSITLRPNHHAALHIGALLMRYGPVHGWWMFPFERVIGALQKTNTNYKMGKEKKLKQIRFGPLMIFTRSTRENDVNFTLCCCERQGISSTVRLSVGSEAMHTNSGAMSG
jgi:hypothetical protein